VYITWRVAILLRLPFLLTQFAKFTIQSSMHKKLPADSKGSDVSANLQSPHSGNSQLCTWCKTSYVKLLMKTLSNCRFYINLIFVSGIRLVNSIFRLDIRLTFCMDTKIVSRLRLINTIFRFKVQVLKL